MLRNMDDGELAANGGNVMDALGWVYEELAP
jgi:hypothetical protein